MSEIAILHMSEVYFNKDDERKAFREDVRAKMLAKIKEHIDKNNEPLEASLNIL